jgi:hypothetical protein
MPRAVPAGEQTDEHPWREKEQRPTSPPWTRRMSLKRSPVARRERRPGPTLFGAQSVRAIYPYSTSADTRPG